VAHHHQHQQPILVGIHGKNDIVDPDLKVRQVYWHGQGVVRVFLEFSGHEYSWVWET
jgi:hypothetical protein